jgi:hypothetical protein
MELQPYLSLVSTSAILAAGIFAGVQLRQLYKQRGRDSALQLFRSFQTPEVTDAINIVFDLPEGLSKNEIETRLGKENIRSVMMLFGTIESLGILIFHREIKIEIVDDFFSGIIILSWKKFERYIREMREIGKRETYYEWVQWLAEQFQKRESRMPAIPSYIAHKDWKE